MGVAAAVAVPRTRKRGALAAALLFVAVFPANLQMAADADTATEKAIAYARLPLQVPLVVWAWWVYSASPTNAMLRISRAHDQTGSRVRSR